jgi:hypothetical protein
VAELLHRLDDLVNLFFGVLQDVDALELVFGVTSLLRNAVLDLGVDRVVLVVQVL